jgi:hypothetical protein
MNAPPYQPDTDSFAFGQSGRTSNYGPGAVSTGMQRYSKPPQTMMEVLMSYAQAIPQYIPTKEQLKEKLTYENAKAVAKSGVEMAKIGGQSALKAAKAVYTGSIEADKVSSKAGAAPNLFGYTGASATPSPQPSPSQYANTNFATKSFSSSDFPAQNQGYHNPFSAPMTTQLNVGYNSSPSRTQPSYQQHQSPSNFNSTPPSSNLDIIEDETDALEETPLETETPKEEVQPPPKEVPKPAVVTPPSNIAANYSFISQLNSPSTSSSTGGTSDVWSMLSQLAKK